MIEARTLQEIVDHFQEQIKTVQEESRDLNLQLLWSMNLFLIKLVEELGSQLGFSFDFGHMIETANEYVSDNFDDLKRDEKEFHEFGCMMEKAYPEKDKDGKNNAEK